MAKDNQFSLTFADENSAKGPVIPQLTPSPSFSDSTLPPNGDVNPYGVAFVPHGFPGGAALHPGDIIVSNFNMIRMGISRLN